MSLLYNDFAFRSRPIGMWGISSRFDPHDSPFYLVNGLFSGAPRDLQRTSADGLDFRLQPGKSTLAALEVGYKAGQSDRFFDLPGTYRGGIIYNSARFSSLSDPADSKRGNLNFYLSADQTVFRESGSNTQGLDRFIMFNVPADSDINLIKFYVAGGLVYTGLIDGRNADRTFVGASYAELNEGIQQLAEDVFHGPSIIPNQSYESVIEAGHAFQVTPFWVITPAVQYIINPGLTDDVDNAVVLGLQTVVTF
jgi:porin